MSLADLPTTRVVDEIPWASEKREARIIVPRNDNDGRPLGAVIAAFESMCCRQFGGFTRAESFGVWFDNSAQRVIAESVFAYDIACDLSSDTAVKLRHLAVNLLRDARQSAIYLRYPNGVIEIVE